MQTWTENCLIHAIHPIIPKLIEPGDLFLDIETTGLSRSRHQIYLIGMATVIDRNHIYVSQLFADYPEDETALLAHFSDELHASNIKRIITFNGNSFDLPFLLERSKVCAVPLDFDDFELLELKDSLTSTKRWFPEKICFSCKITARKQWNSFSALTVRTSTPAAN